MSRFSPPGQQFQPRQGRPGTLVRLNGTDFDAGKNAVVKVGDKVATIIGPRSSSAIDIQIPTDATPGAQKISITFTIESDDLFAVDSLPPPPKFCPRGQQFSPMTGRAGDTITICGENFDTGGPGVKPRVSMAFGDLDVISHTGTEIVATVPPVPDPPPPWDTFTITVETMGGVVTSDDYFTDLDIVH